MTTKKEAKGKLMKFGEDKFVGGVCVYNKGAVYEIPLASVERWQKRGGVLVDENGKELDEAAKSGAEVDGTAEAVTQGEKEKSEEVATEEAQKADDEATKPTEDVAEGSEQEDSNSGNKKKKKHGRN